MSDENRGPTGSDDGKWITRRVSTAERDAVIVLLDEHWQAGRLDRESMKGASRGLRRP